jgi:hypothetical protein
MYAENGGAFACKGQLLINSQLQGERLYKFRKIFSTLVHIMLAMMRTLNYSSSFSYPLDNCFKEEEILLYPQLLFKP